LAAEIRNSLGIQAELIGGGRGDFIVMADQRTVWDKKAMGNRFPDDADVLNLLKES
jgi:hypothetical protein